MTSCRRILSAGTSISLAWWLIESKGLNIGMACLRKGSDMLMIGLAVFIMLVNTAAAESTPKAAIPQLSKMTRVNLQIDAEFTQKDKEMEETHFLQKVTEELKRKGIKATIFVTADFANTNPYLLKDLFKEGFEIALHGHSTGEQLVTMTKEAQKDLLARAKAALEGCAECGSLLPVTGFRPQNFSQNADTYAIHAELGIRYNSGFKAKLFFLPGHENTVQPYRDESHSIWIVPVSTFHYKGDLACLCDLSAQEKFKGEEWEEILSSKLSEAIGAGEPLVMVIHGWLTGDKKTYGYWQAFLNFLDYAQNRKVDFVTTRELIEAYAPYKIEDSSKETGKRRILQYQILEEEKRP